MRIVIDLQACQNAGSRFRGIGRYSKSLALAMVGQGRGHDFWIALNGALVDAVEDIRASFDGLLPQDQIVLWDNPFPASAHQPDAAWKLQTAEVLREDFLSALQPDFVHLASLFEGWGDPVATSIGRGSAPRPRTAVTLYDLIPLTSSDQYLPDARTRGWYDRKLVDLRQADLSLAISAFTQQEAIQVLGLPASRIVNISGSTDAIFRRLEPDGQRSSALAARYGIWRPFVMYTGGFDPRKNVAGLVRAYAALPGPIRERRQLVIVGAPPADVRAGLMAVAASCGLAGDDVRFVGFVPDRDLVGLYNACELYVFPSRLEGFGLPALEAMACGAPVIGANATSLPEVIGYPEAMFAADSDDAMSASMLQGLTDHSFRQRLVEHGAERVQCFSWADSARKALDAMEATVERAPRASPSAPRGGETDPRWQHVARQSAQLSRLVAEGRPTDANSARRLAAAQAENSRWPGREKQLIVDVSNLAGGDAQTGIQRVVRNILRELLNAAPAGYAVAPVYFDGAGDFRHARGFLHRFLDQDGKPGDDDVLDAGPGDIFLGLDLSAHIIPHNYEVFDRLRRRGVPMYFVVYDLIPMQRPDSVNPDSLLLLQAWYQSIGTLADGLCCISAAVAAELFDWCDQARPARLRPLRIGHFHLGADLDRHAVASPLPGDVVAARKTGRRRFLMVGTIEPRKGHVQALDAFELLWAQGADVELAIVGRPGWLMDEFVDRLGRHAESGARLHWFNGVDDARLARLYEQSCALIAASEAEGFGLPIVESASYGLPVIARDLAVFREVAAEHAFYFNGYEASDLAAAVREWLVLESRGDAPDSGAIGCLSWRESTNGLLGLVMQHDWGRFWLSSDRYWFPASDTRLQHQVGSFQRELLRTDGRSGYLVYGPYASLPAGYYRLRALGRWMDTGGATAWLDVVTSQGKQQLVHVEIQPAGATQPDTLVEVTVALDVDANDLEIRLWVSADSSLDIRGFELVRVESPIA